MSSGITLRIATPVSRAILIVWADFRLFIDWSGLFLTRDTKVLSLTTEEKTTRARQTLETVRFTLIFDCSAAVVRLLWVYFWVYFGPILGTFWVYFDLGLF